MYTINSSDLNSPANPIDANKSSAPFLSIVIPVYNEEENLDILYKEIRRSVDFLKKPYEIIFVDDGSSDNSLQRLTALKKKENEENVVIFTFSCGNVSKSYISPKTKEIVCLKCFKIHRVSDLTKFKL